MSIRTLTNVTLGHVVKQGYAMIRLRLYVCGRIWMQFSASSACDTGELV